MFEDDTLRSMITILGETTSIKIEENVTRLAGFSPLLLQSTSFLLPQKLDSTTFASIFIWAAAATEEVASQVPGLLVLFFSKRAS